MKTAEGVNSNPFYEVPVIKKPLIDDRINENTLELNKTFTYDLLTKSGKNYSLRKQK